MMGHDWMFETPSLLFNEVDESEVVHILNDLELLCKSDKDMSLFSFVRGKHLLTSFPCLTPDRYTRMSAVSYRNWNDGELERTVVLHHPAIGPLATFSSDAWLKTPQYDRKEDMYVGLSAFVYTLRPVQSTAVITPLTDRHDDGTSYFFSGAVLENIRKEECFYHLGWIADMAIDMENGESLNIKVWIHKKNSELPPEPGILYEGELWLQSRLEDKS